MNRRRPLPEILEGRPFAVHEARAAGVPVRRLDADDLDAPVFGARVPAGGDRLAGVSAVLRPGQAFTGPTAAKLWRMPLPRRWQDDGRIWVSTLSRDRAMRRPDVVASRRSSGESVIVGGYAVLDPARTWSSLAPLLVLHDLTAVADGIVTSSPGHPALASSGQLRDVASATGRGSRALRAALAEMRLGSWSRTESLLRIALLRAGLPEPLLNPTVTLGGGRVAVPDMAWPDYSVCVEYDGDWHDDRQRRAADLERHELLVDAGWSVTHIRSRDLFPEPRVAVARVLRRLHARGYRHPGNLERAELTGWKP